VHIINKTGPIIHILKSKILLTELYYSCRKTPFFEVKRFSGWPLPRHCKIPGHFPDNTRHSCPR